MKKHWMLKFIPKWYKWELFMLIQAYAEARVQTAKYGESNAGELYMELLELLK